MVKPARPAAASPAAETCKKRLRSKVLVLAAAISISLAGVGTLLLTVNPVHPAYITD
jgi:hypothetical protein